MLPFSPIVADQIRFLLQSCNDSNFDSVLSQLCEFAEYGSEGNILLLQTCLDQIDFHSMNTDVLVKPDIVSFVLRYLMGRPNFSTVFCEASRKAWLDDTFLESLSKALNLSIFEKFGISLALTDSEHLELRVRGQSFCISLIEKLCENSTSYLSHELIRDVVMFLHRSEGLSKHTDSFTKILSLLDTKETLPFLLSPILTVDSLEVDSTRHLNLFEECPQSDFDFILSEIETEISMADVMGELGYGCTVDTSRCIDMLSLFLPLTEVTIAKLLGTIVRTRVGHEDNLHLYSTFSTVFGCNATSDTSPATWNINVLVDSIKKLAPATNWMHVFENLDQESFYIPDDESFYFFMSIYSYACQNPFPLYAICGYVWKNVEGQLSFLRHAVSAPPKVFTFAHSERKLTHIDPMYYPNGHGNQAWLSLELLDVLCELAERGHAIAVREMLEYPIKECPDLLLLGITHSQTAYNLLQYEVFTTMLPDLLKKSKSGLISHLWDANSSLVLHGFLHAYSMDIKSIEKILDISEELKILTCILDSAPFSFSIRLAAIASQKELIDLEKWLNENFREHKDPFFEVAFQFLKDNFVNATTDVPRDTSDTSAVGPNISQESCQKVLKVFQAHLGQIASPQLSGEVKRFYSSLFDSGKQSVGTIEMSAEGSTDDVETEANKYFHQMFSGQLSIDTTIQMLGRFKEYPDDKREKRIFDCMIGNLFEEYKFFPKYPDRQLKIAAVLFGSLIKHQLVTHLTLGIALRCVLDALRKSVDSKMFLFGAKALEQFRERLVEWPQYCNHILQISHLRNTHSELVLFIERALARISSSQLDSNGPSNSTIDHSQSSSSASVENADMQQRNQDFIDDRVKAAPIVKPTLSSSVLAPSNIDTVNNQKATTTQCLQTTHPPTGASTAAASSPGFVRPRVAAPTGVLRPSSYSTGFGAALNIETLVAAAERRDSPIEAPASEIQDKIHFIINNISATNVDTKAKEFLDVLKEEYYAWFAEYMVMKRASIEPNFHDLYLKFLDKVSSRSLNKEIVKATYENCKVLLRSDLIKSSSEERSLLKNLGSWLGKFTIGRNQALRAREIDPKVLIMEAYEKGLMIAVIPFTSKILEPCQCSLAYQPPNPWTMAILGLLVEIYNLPNLKMNLKFDIEVLFKNLGVDMKDVKPTSLLKDRIREVEGNPDFSNKDISTSQTPAIAESNSALISPLNQFEIQSQVTNASHPGGHPSGLSQYTGALHIALSTMDDDDKSGSLSISERGLSSLAQSQVTPSVSSFTNQLLTPISNISSHIVINTKLSALGLQMHLQRIIPLAMERAVAEIISAVVTRSVTISLQTTKELVQKDYSMESDENRIRNAAKLMVSSLAGSLAHVTCKEPLRMSLSTHLRTLLQNLNVSNDLLEQAIQIITNDNLDLGCALVEQSATEKALQNIEGDIGPFIAFKKKQRESSGSYYDAAAYAQGTFARVPESLRPKPGHLSNNQQRVYEEFVKYPWHNQSSQNPSIIPTSGQLGSSAGSLNSTLARGYGSSSGQLQSGVYTISSAASGLGVPQSSDLVSDVIDPGSMQILSYSVPPTHSGADDVSVNQTAETISVVPSYSPASPELLVTDPSLSTKELGAVVPFTAATERPGVPIIETLTVGNVLDKYHVLAQKLEIFPKDSRESDVQNLIQEVATELREALLKCTSRDEAALSVSQKIFKHLYENASNCLQVGAHLALLGAVRDVSQLVVMEITNWVVFSDEERKFNKDISIGLIRSELLNLADYDVHLAKLIDDGRNKAALEFVMSLLHALLNQEPSFGISEFYNLMDVLTKLSLRPGSPESLHQLINMAKNSIANVSSLPGTNVSREERHRQIRDKRAAFVRSVSNMDECIGSDALGADPVGFREQASLLFAEWFRICECPTSEVAATNFISQLQQNGFLKGDELTERFFRVVTELTVLHCLASEQVTHLQQVPVLSFVAIDIFAKLVVLFFKYSVDQGSNKIALLPKILSVIARVIQKDAEEKKTSFNSRPYFRLFFDLLMDLTSPDSIIDGGNFQVLTSFANCLHTLQPAKVPGFSFAWLELISHRSFMPKLLMVNGQKGWPFFQRLLVDLLKFIEPYVRNAELREPVLFLYKGTLRMLLVLLHDFPEFLCDYHFSFCDVIPSSCIQMRNIILSAFPVNMRLPDPCTPNLKIDLLPEITQSPRILSEIDGSLKAKQIKADVDEYLKMKNQESFLTDLKQRLLLPLPEVHLAGTRYNIPLINSLVLYVGMQAIQQLQNNVSSQHVPTQGAHSGPMDIFLVSAAMDIFNHLMQDLDTEGRYIFLNAVANQLRYPNNHTHYFSFVLLYLFVEAKEEIIQEQITRVLLERLIVNRPHPWGLLITFIELIKNPRYDFWSKQFIHCAPEIENLFDQVSRSCGGSRVDDLVSALPSGVH